MYSVTVRVPNKSSQEGQLLQVYRSVQCSVVCVAIAAGAKQTKLCQTGSNETNASRSRKHFHHGDGMAKSKRYPEQPLRRRTPRGRRTQQQRHSSSSPASRRGRGHPASAASRRGVPPPRRSPRPISRVGGGQPSLPTSRRGESAGRSPLPRPLAGGLVDVQRLERRRRRPGRRPGPAFDAES
jgi:hypothetical protein